MCEIKFGSLFDFVVAWSKKRGYDVHLTIDKVSDARPCLELFVNHDFSDDLMSQATDSLLLAHHICYCGLPLRSIFNDTNSISLKFWL